VRDLNSVLPLSEEGRALPQPIQGEDVRTINLPPDLDIVLERSWAEARKVPGHLVENEARFLGLLAACVPVKGSIVEIGSFKGRSTVMLAKIAAHYGLGPIVAIDPHNSPILHYSLT
jgi:predicted O-methyltransferase YrrM